MKALYILLLIGAALFIRLIVVNADKIDNYEPVAWLLVLPVLSVIVVFAVMFYFPKKGTGKKIDRKPLK